MTPEMTAHLSAAVIWFFGVIFGVMVACGVGLLLLALVHGAMTHVKRWWWYRKLDRLRGNLRRPTTEKDHEERYARAEGFTVRGTTSYRAGRLR